MALKHKISKTCGKLGNVPVIGAILKPKPKVAIIRMSGVIADAGMKRGGISYHKYRSSIKDAFDVFDLKAVALVINSPGGSPAQSQLLGDYIRRLADEKDVPVYAFIEDVAASGGYCLACAADEIYGVSSSIAGSIGVISSGFGFQELIHKHGVERRVHTAGKDKSFLDPFLHEKPEDVLRLKSLQEDLHEIFKDWVRERRGDRLTGDDKEMFEGQFWTADKAIDLGILDGIGEVRSFAQEKFGEDIKFAEFTPDKSFMPSLLGMEAKASLPDDIAEAVETKAAWARFGV
ncbi:MAG: S49 family peptidase [Alphaproteobacteria bacterium]|nr:S49 family peptidase [Alphaproteobacteria bacterium]